MLEKLTRRLLWDKRLSPRWSRVWGLLILLAPLALAAAVYLQWTIQRQVPARVTLDRESALDSARKFLDAKGQTVSGWKERVNADAKMELYRYLVRKQDAGTKVLNSLGAWSTISVQFEDPQTGQKDLVLLSPANQVAGYRFTFGESQEIQSALDASQARALADEALRDTLQPFPYLHATFDGSETVNSKVFVFRWKLAADGLPDLEPEAIVRIRGKQVVQSAITVKLRAEGQNQVKEPSRGVTKSLFIIYAFVLFAFMLVRYFKRRAQREVSRQRMFLVTVIIAGFVLAMVLLQDEVLNISKSSDLPIPAWLPIVILAITAYLAGQCAGVAYAASEGDLREAHPHLLTSLDALLCGRIFSRNVGRSVLLGIVILAWMLLARNAVYLGSRPEFAGVDSFQQSYDLLLSRIPSLSLLLTAASTAVFVCLTAVMTPLSILERLLKRPRWIFPALVLCAALSVSFIFRFPLDAPAAWLVRLIYISGIFIAFFKVDLLAAIALQAASIVVIVFTSLIQMAPGLDGQGLDLPGGWGLMIAATILIVQVSAAFWGRSVDENAVRPAYAQEIQERLQLESEVDAAREAQLRLLPGGPPVIPGLSISASCRAAEKVSGDFYDFYPISKTKVGVFICDGGGNGLAAALTIALAKGFLMHKAGSTANPLEILRSLEAALGRQLGGIAVKGVCYLVVDVLESTIRYARYGETPGIFVAGSDEAVHEILQHGNGVPMWEGFARLAETSRLIVYTDGVSRLVGEPDRSATNRWLTKRIGGLLWQSTAELHDSIMNAIFTRRGRLGKRTAVDDVTLLVCTISRLEAAVREQVA